MIDIKTIDDIIEISDMVEADEDLKNETWQITPCDENGNYNEKYIDKMSVGCDDGYAIGSCSYRLNINGHYLGALFLLFGDLKPGERKVLSGKDMEAKLETLNKLDLYYYSSCCLQAWLYHANTWYPDDSESRVLEPYYEVKYLGEME